MSQLPQIVKERLRASGAAGAHPDPDVLTAFSERLLPANERAVVMEHLARCGDCREILSLALPASETAAGDEVRAVQPGRSWLSWPALRWGFALAGVAIVAGIGFVEYQQRNRSAEMAYSQKSAQKEIGQTAPVSSSVEAKVAAPPVQRSENPTPERKSVAASTSRDVAPLPSSQLRNKSQSMVASGASGGIATYSAQGVRGETGANIAMKAAPAESTAPASPAPRAHPAASTQQPPPPSDLAQQAPAQQTSEMVEVQSQATTVTTADQGQDSTQKQLDLPRARQQQRATNDPIYFHAEEDKDKEISRAKAPVPQAIGTTNGNVGAPISGAVTVRNLRPLAAPSWNITAAGTLQRSLDGGKAWEDVDVSNVRMFSDQTTTGRDANSVGLLAKDARTTPSANEKKKQDKVASSGLIFRAVSANVFDVWAGGSGGALYHSVDGGNQWTRVFPTVDSVVLTADIASIQFSDPGHGTVTTTASEVWTTTDGGHSWQRR